MLAAARTRPPSVANGEAEIGMTQISEILPYAGADLVGPLPAEIQPYHDLRRRRQRGRQAGRPRQGACSISCSVPDTAKVIRRPRGSSPR